MYGGEESGFSRIAENKARLEALGISKSGIAHYEKDLAAKNLSAPHSATRKYVFDPGWESGGHPEAVDMDAEKNPIATDGDVNEKIVEENLFNLFSSNTIPKAAYVENPLSLLGSLITRRVAPVTLFRGDLDIIPTMKIKVWVYNKVAEERLPTLKMYSHKALPTDKFAKHEAKIDYDYKVTAQPSEERSVIAVSAIAREMTQTNKVAIVRCVCRDGQGNVVVGVLTPNVSERDDTPDSFYFNVLPFAEDVREFPDEPDEQQEALAYNFVKMLDITPSAKEEVLKLEPKNILGNADCKFKICDFGLPRVPFNDTPTAIFWTDYVDTRCYRAPELCGSFLAKALVEREPSACQRRLSHMARGSSSNQQSMDAEKEGVSSDGAASLADAKKSKAPKTPSLWAKLWQKQWQWPCRKKLAKYDLVEWSLVVHPGRYVSVDPGKLLLIKKVSFVTDFSDWVVMPDDAPRCEVYMGINSTHEEYLLGYLEVLNRENPETWAGLDVDLVTRKKITLGHSGLSSIRFDGYRYSPRSRRMPQPSEGPEELSWPLNSDLTAQVLSKLSSSEVAIAECVCKLFKTAGHNPISYTEIDLCDRRYGEDLTALMCMRRAHGKLRSLAVGYSYSPSQVNFNILYTRRFLEPPRYLGKSLTKLKLVGLELIHPDDLSPVFASCAELIDVEIHSLLHVSVGYVMLVVATHCKKLKRLAYTDSVHLQVDEASLQALVTSCPGITYLGLCSVDLSDSLVVMILQGLKKLRTLNLSSSGEFTGTCFMDVGEVNLILEVLILQRCENLQEAQLRRFFQELRLRKRDNNYFHYLKKLEFIGELHRGFEGRIGRGLLAEARPHMKMQLSFSERLQWVGYDEEALNQYRAEYNPLWENQDFEESDGEDVIDYDELDDEQDDEQDEEVDNEEYGALLGGFLLRRRKRFIYW